MVFGVICSCCGEKLQRDVPADELAVLETVVRALSADPPETPRELESALCRHRNDRCRVAADQPFRQLSRRWRGSTPAVCRRLAEHER